ncbi:MAG: hypothetical protein A3H06_00420 [Candidatus Colwellbacteria bacterium RIFCSPLOWO2_12_FULL_44_13]|uniref:DUF1648 domain-containing protein n=3 Tax=Candidatus Colwelliibacteriota TaxID=1817904 RepID=A0A1G1Z5B2_9BACT|nr:MAG: hypothetical protein A3F24_02030 [Candidatus Colwellbacteria bacterium RIFCSPHIGHO2_12_FULL_44_17]OGY59831.1 MAG: hypothetical protein A3I31_01645 [Candidatus Colwellbacteria bacterium RIFCSPLOWO2_02_FULL_44_20b]OGY61556.1 MAG: hypothetical protein A3H06_00420 [Candidatus Colwellbacteria bacterium RIFCSPLOWO2_12_FULL_44_13]
MKPKPLTTLFIISFVALILATLVGYLNTRGISGELIFHFGKGGKADLVGTIATFYKIMGMSLGVLLINWIIGRELIEKETTLAYILGSVSLVFSLLLLVFALYIVSFN